MSLSSSHAPAFEVIIVVEGSLEYLCPIYGVSFMFSLQKAAGEKHFSPNRVKIMILYHTGDREIKKPDIHHGRKNADFGWGFYLTPDREFTYRWARDNAMVNVFELDETGLDIHTFSRDVDWFQYIYHNRRAHDDLTDDVVIGPIANDTLFDTLGVISSGFLKPEDALRLLKIGPEYTQVAIKSQKAAQQLRWIRSEQIERMDKATLKTEQDAYQKAFSAEIGRILKG